MATLEEISLKADELQTALDAEQAQVATLLAEKDATIATLSEIITDLEGQIADGGTVEQRQALLDKLIALKADTEATVPPTGSV